MGLRLITNTPGPAGPPGPPGTGAIVSFGANNVGQSTTTRYLYPWFDDTQGQTSPVPWRAPRAGTFRNMRLRQNNPAGNGNLIVYTLRVNGIPTALSVSIASTGTDADDLVNTVAVVAGDLIDLEITKALATGAAPINVMCVMELA